MSEAEKNKCEICGEPMPDGEEMFQFHGYSGPCPKPPINNQIKKVMVEYHLVGRDGEFWIDIYVERKPYDKIGPFSSQRECEFAYEDLLNMQRHAGAKDAGSA